MVRQGLLRLVLWEETPMFLDTHTGIVRPYAEQVLCCALLSLALPSLQDSGQSNS
jgi:hypothetical protein